MAAPASLRTLAAGLACVLAAPALAAAAAPTAQAADPVVRTFELPKAAADAPDPAEPAGAMPVRLPSASDALRATLGLGYVQGADWGSEFGAVGSFAGIQLHLDGLVTQGTAGTRLDRGALLLSDPDRQWRVAAGDVFSPLRGAARGARFSWAGRGGRRPAVAVYASRPGASRSDTVLTYRDSLHAAGQTLLDAEIATDGSWMAATRWRLRTVDLEASYRDRPRHHETDYGVAVGVDVWRGVRLGVNAIRYQEAGARFDWESLSLRVPIGRWLDVTLERTRSRGPDTVSTSHAVMAGVSAGRARLFHRYQQGRTAVASPEFDAVVAHEQLQSMATYAAGPRLNLTMQLATAWTASGRAEHWQELVTSATLWPTARVQLVTAVPDVTNPDRLRLRVAQALPSDLTLIAEFGRVSAFQSLRPGQDAPRARVMLSRAWTIGTPARGAVVAGRVLDHAGHPVGGVRVTLGPYSTSSDADGSYLFKGVPRGRYDLALDPAWLPATYAWNGDGRSFDVRSSDRIHADLRVTPLNAIHGRVVVDRDGDGRIGPDEGVRDVVVRLGDRVTATDATGSFAFFNLWPGDYVVSLDVARLPDGLAAEDVSALPVTLGGEGPVTAADLSVRVVSKPIRWRSGGGR